MNVVILHVNRMLLSIVFSKDTPFVRRKGTRHNVLVPSQEDNF